MKQYLGIAFLSIICICCNSVLENVPDDSDINNLTQDMLMGIWTDIHNDLYYIAFTNDGKFSMCLNEMVIGTGTYRIKNDKLVLYNKFSSVEDEIGANITNGTLQITGRVLSNKLLMPITITNTLRKTSLYKPVSVAGETRPLPTPGVSLPAKPVGYDKIEIKAEYVDDYTATFLSRGLKYSGVWEIFCKYKWIYVYRPPYTYTQNVNDNTDNVTIYNLDKQSLHKYLTTNVVAQ